jgi:hypothetical protein
MHFEEITRLASDRGWLKTAGRTPQATMGAALYVDVNQKGQQSRFVRSDKPSYFALNPDFEGAVDEADAVVNDYPLCPDLSDRQKGDVIEARIAELITLYGEASLSCFRPISDDEGIDLIVKRKGRVDKTVFLQIKSRFGIDPGSPFTATFRPPTHAGDNFGFVFCHFDVSQGDLWQYLWFVPCRDLLKTATPLSDGRLHFVSGMTRRDTNQYNRFLIDKRGLANKLLEVMRSN